MQNNYLNIITQEIALKVELDISPYTSKSTDNSLKPIGQITNPEVILVEENTSILSSSKESIPPQTERKSKGKDPEEDELKVEDSEATEKIKEELEKMRRSLEMAIEDPEQWLALELSCINEEDEGESPQKKFKMDLKPPEENSSGIEEDYFNLLQEETAYISDTDKYLLSEEPKENIINPLEKRKSEELENKSSIITEDKIDQVGDKDIQKGIKQRMEIVEVKVVESEDDLKLYQQNNGDLEDKYKQGRIFEDL
ncbi:hypothetical protein O181_052317 [Austropuccinia psidii MF-1]|uniref:Uncharacterized protein n=1 Tax=Austropuccinia psidii MF-1 TaxID=1389203 RepID=A0A9Q3E2P2_9BASI|nr:hypothetical protein [Austropuccinia psidii MF-1]